MIFLYIIQSSAKSLTVNSVFLQITLRAQFAPVWYYWHYSNFLR